MTNKFIFDYQTYGHYLDSLVQKIQPQFIPTHIYSPPRGGWPIAVHLSHHLKIPIIQEWGTGDWPIIKRLDMNSILFVDDIVDSGHTLEQFISTVKRKRSSGWWLHQCSCSLIVKPRASTKPDISVMEVADQTWVVFPWEKIEEAEADQKLYLQGRGKE